GKICVRAVPLVLVLFCGTARPPATQDSSLDAETLAANRELDQKFLDGHAMKSSDSLVSLFSSRPDVVFIAPNGTINRGRVALRVSPLTLASGNWRTVGDTFQVAMVES